MELSNQATPSFQQLCDLEPRLLDFFPHIREFRYGRRRDQSGGADLLEWLGAGKKKGIRTEIGELVGPWRQGGPHPVLSKFSAYDVVCDVIYEYLTHHCANRWDGV